MTIDETISELEILKKNTFSYMTANRAFTTAIDTMRKYKKIQEIYKRFQKDGNYYHHMAWLDVMEVVQDGNDD